MKVSVYKFDPSKDKEPYYVHGEVPYKEDMTALEILQYFHENIAAINFDYSCACRLCGRCAMTINGVPGLACVIRAEDKDYTFEPLHNYPVIRDLIVDKSSMDDRLSSIYHRVRIEDLTAENYDEPRKFDYAHRDDLYAMEYCARCGACTAACPIASSKPDEYMGPMAMIAFAYRHLDPFDQGDRVLEAVSNGLFYCIECGMCDTVCSQQDIHHVDLFRMLKDEARARDIVPSYAK